MIYIGCCGFPVSRKKYFDKFHVVEIQQTFYQIPREKTLGKWRGEAPAEFEFIVKAWQGITHSITSPTWRRFKGILTGDRENYGELKYTDEVLDAWKKTVKAMDILRSNKVLIQLPPRLKWSDEIKEDVISTLTEFSKSGKHLILEPRHMSWWSRNVEKIFRELDIVHCIDPFKHEKMNTGRFCYFRLHGKNGYNYSYKYTENDFRRLFSKLTKFFDEDCYMMFNNKYMYENALDFKKTLIDKKFKIH